MWPHYEDRFKIVMSLILGVARDQDTFVATLYGQRPTGQWDELRTSPRQAGMCSPDAAYREFLRMVATDRRHMELQNQA